MTNLVSYSKLTDNPDNTFCFCLSFKPKKNVKWLFRWMILKLTMIRNNIHLHAPVILGKNLTLEDVLRNSICETVSSTVKSGMEIRVSECHLNSDAVAQW